MEFVQRGGRGQTPNSNFFGIHFGSIEIKIWGQFRAIDTYFWVNKKFGQNPYFHFFLDELPYRSITFNDLGTIIN